MEEQNCPYCGAELEIDAPRWNSLVVCAACNEKFFLRYDFVPMEDEYEWDIYNAEKLDPEGDYRNEDTLPSKIAIN